MATEFNDASHWGFFMTGTTLTSSTGKYTRVSELVLAGLRAQGVFDNMVDGITAPTIDKLWLDKNSDPAVLKEWDATGSAWVPMTFERLFGRAIVTPMAAPTGTANALVVAEPDPFIRNRMYSLTPVADNTGAVTIQVTGVGTFNATYADGSALEAQEFKTGNPTVLLFTGSRFEVLFKVADIYEARDQAVAVASALPAISANTMMVDNAAGTAREAKSFAVVKNLLGYFDTEAAFLAANVPDALQYVDTAGYSAKGDGGGHRKVRIAGPGTEPWQKQSADGAWWDIAEQQEYLAEIFGFGAGGSDTASWELAVDFITTRGGTLRAPAGEFTLTNDLSVTSAAMPFRIIGAGKDVTIFKRADTGISAFWNIVTSDDYVISDLTLNCQRSNGAVGTGSHALRMDRGTNIVIHRVKVTDFTDTGIIYFDTADTENGLHDDVSVIECYVDGLSTANNGILLCNTRRGLMAHNKVINLGRQGAPQFAIQFKARNVDGKSIGNWIENCRGGVAIGSTEVASPSNVNCHSTFEIVKGATRALRIASSSFCTIHAEIVDMDEASDAGNPTEDTDEHAVFLNQVDNCVIRIGHLRNYEDTKYVVAILTAAGCSVLIDTWRNVPNTSKFLDLGAGASGNVIEVKNYVGTRFDFPMDMVQNASASANTFRTSDDVMAQRTTIASDAITILNPAVARYRLDTEAAAATDNLATINGGTDGQVVVFTTTSDARDVVLKHNTGNIFLKGAADRTLGTINDIVMLMYSSFASKWIEI